jgi:hypothetical protein
LGSKSRERSAEQMDTEALFNKLVQAENEDAVEAILRNAGYLDDASAWLPLGAIPNNFAVASNQQSDPTGAMVEKIINAIDAVLMREAFKRGINPEGSNAPHTMRDAVELFFGVRQGQINSLTPEQQRHLAEEIQVVAVGTRSNPSYLIIDKGEGQTPAMFAKTFLSIVSENKMKIPFVQGKYNSGGLGILQFCGDKNYQLIASRRHPEAPIHPDDDTGSLWGFTLVRRLRPAGGRRSSMYIYLAPGGQVPSFKADGIKVLPGKSSSNKPAPPYALDLPSGSCIKLYSYQWGRPKTLITLDARNELERFLPSPALPFRITDTREGYKAHYYSTTITGSWTSATTEDEEGESKKLEEGFPAYGDMILEGIGTLPYQIAVFKEVKRDRSLPRGVHFVVNGQVHGSLPSDYVTRRLKFDYLGGDGPLYVLVDCTGMQDDVREDFFMASRDRVRRNKTYSSIEERLTQELRDHPGLQALNQLRRQKVQEKFLGEEGPLDAFQSLISTDPTLASLFGGGDRLVTSTGPGDPPSFTGRKFPTFFRLAKEPKGGLVKGCPINKTVRIEFETDAQNDYFKRLDDPGEVTIEPPDLLEHNHLWNGRWDTRFRVPWDAKPGDLIPVTVTVMDVMRTMPFVSTFTLRAEEEASDVERTSGGRNGQRKPTPGTNQTRVALAPPHPIEVRKEDWDEYGFDKYGALLVRHSPDGGYDYYVNIDNAFLLTELSRAKEEDKPMVKFWFKWGLVLGAVGMIKHNNRLAAALAEARTKNGYSASGEEDEPENMAEDLEAVARHCSGLAQVIVPAIRTLSRAPLTPVAPDA